MDQKGKRYYESYAILAGADILAQHSLEEFLALPHDNLKAALTYHLVNHVGGETRTWDEKIISVFPSLAQAVLSDIWRAQLAGGEEEHLTGSHVGRTEDIRTPIILNEIPNLLSERPALPPRILEHFLKIILHNGDTEVLRPLFPIALGDTRVRGVSRTLWLAVAALLSPDKYAARLGGRAQPSSRDVIATFEILTNGAGSLTNGLGGVLQLQMSISFLGKFFNNVRSDIGRRTVRRRGPEDAAQAYSGID